MDDGFELEVPEFSVAAVDQVHLAGSGVEQEGMEDDEALSYLMSVLIWHPFPPFPQLSIHTLCASGQNTPTESTSHPSGSERFPKRKRRE